MSTNSLEAFAEVELSKRQEEVFEIISSVGEISAKGIAFSMKVPINKVTGRINELMHKQRIKIVRTGKDVAGGKNVNYYAVRQFEDHLNVFEKSWEEKYKELELWLKIDHSDILEMFKKR